MGRNREVLRGTWSGVQGAEEYVQDQTEIQEARMGKDLVCFASQWIRSTLYSVQYVLQD